MSQFLEMDIFFFITTVVVVAIGILAVVILLRIWRILGHVEDISRDVSEESHLLRNDIEELRRKIGAEGFKLAHLGALGTMAMKHFKRKGKRAPREKDV
ncbi:MAG TPA: hypothetical protein VMU27_01905 [Candidatus Paceibacterota bacterium]|nr:hypothetical protein [Candidatus Paceibacterota bacterium]